MKSFPGTNSDKTENGLARQGNWKPAAFLFVNPLGLPRSGARKVETLAPKCAALHG
jgi:hypothetical protein